MKDIEAQIEKNIDLLKQIRCVSLSTKDNDDKKAALFQTYFFIGSTHFDSINMLIDKESYHSAFALIRVLFESVIKGTYYAYILDDTEIKKMFENDNPLKPFQIENWKSFKIKQWKSYRINDMCTELDKHFKHNMYECRREQMYRYMCEYIHSSKMAVAQCFLNEKAYKNTNFTNAEILDVLEKTHDVMYLFVQKYIEFMKGLKLLIVR